MSELVQWLLENEPEFRKSRLPSLYSDLGQLKASNPDGFKANAAAWQSALTRAVLAGKISNQKLVLHSSPSLLSALRTSQYGQPTGLGYVLDAAVEGGKLLPISDFNNAEHSIYQKSWLPTPMSAVKWTLRKAGLLSAGSFDNNGNLKDGQIVILEGLEQLAGYLAAIKDQSPNITDRVMTKDAFARLVQNSEIGALTLPEIEILLRFMRRDKGLVAYNENVVKFKSPSDENAEEVTEEDSSIASIKAYIETLESTIAQLSSKITVLQNQAQLAVQSKNRSAALSALRSKRRAEQALETRTASLHQVQDVYGKIEQAIDQSQLVRLMQSSAQTLKALNSRTGGVERVDEIMEDLREQMANTDEIGQVMQEPLSSGMIVDETEVDDELLALEQEEKARHDLAEAETTQRRLTELEAEEAKMAQRQAKEADDLKLEQQLSNSSQQLENLHLDNYQINKEPDREAQMAT